MESNEDFYNFWGTVGGVDLVLVEEKGERKVVDIISKGLEFCNDINLSEIKDVFKIDVCDFLNVKDIVFEK